jgi:hypothetical protein
MFRFRKKQQPKVVYFEHERFERGPLTKEAPEEDDDLQSKHAGSDETVSNTSCDSSVAFEDVFHKRCLKVRTQEESLERITMTVPRSVRSKVLSVSFSEVEIRKHYLILGDNPAVTAGPPLAIDWDAHATETISVDDFETQRPPKKPLEDLKMPVLDRKIYIRDLLYTREQVQETMQSVYEIKASRIETKAVLKEQKQKKKQKKVQRRRSKRLIDTGLIDTDLIVVSQ